MHFQVSCSTDKASAFLSIVMGRDSGQMRNLLRIMKKTEEIVQGVRHFALNFMNQI